MSTLLYRQVEPPSFGKFSGLIRGASRALQTRALSVKPQRLQPCSLEVHDARKPGFGFESFGFRFLGFWVSGFGRRVWVFGFRFSVLEFRFSVYDFRGSISVFGLGVSGFGLTIDD